jgi:hypothetical protein
MYNMIKNVRFLNSKKFEAMTLHNLIKIVRFVNNEMYSR